MKYLSYEYMLEQIDEYCEGKTWCRNCSIQHKCRRSFKNELLREEAFLHLVLEEVQDEIPK